MSVLRSRWALIQPGWSPSARQWASCAVDECAVNENTSGRALYIFGGFGVAPGNDLSKFSLVDRLWTRVPLVGESREQDPVPARYYHASAVVDGYLYIFGGASASDGKPLDDFYKISLASRTVKPMLEMTNAPTARRGMTATVGAGGVVFFVGGCTEAAGPPLDGEASVFAFSSREGRWLDREWLLDGARGSIPLPNAAASLPRGARAAGAELLARHSHTATLASAERLLLFGGWTALSGAAGDATVVQLHTRTGRCVALACTGTPPAPRYAHAAALIGGVGGHVAVVGGRDARRAFDDVHLLEHKACVWSTLNPTPAPGGQPQPARWSGCAGALGGRLLLWGGLDGIETGRFCTTAVASLELLTGAGAGAGAGAGSAASSVSAVAKAQPAVRTVATDVRFTHPPYPGLPRPRTDDDDDEVGDGGGGDDGGGGHDGASGARLGAPLTLAHAKTSALPFHAPTTPPPPALTRASTAAVLGGGAAAPAARGHAVGGRASASASASRLFVRPAALAETHPGRASEPHARSAAHLPDPHAADDQLAAMAAALAAASARADATDAACATLRAQLVARRRADRARAAAIGALRTWAPALVEAEAAASVVTVDALGQAARLARSGRALAAALEMAAVATTADLAVLAEGVRGACDELGAEPALTEMLATALDADFAEWRAQAAELRGAAAGAADDCAGWLPDATAASRQTFAQLAAAAAEIDRLVSTLDDAAGADADAAVADAEALAAARAQLADAHATVIGLSAARDELHADGVLRAQETALLRAALGEVRGANERNRALLELATSNVAATGAWRVSARPLLEAMAALDGSKAVQPALLVEQSARAKALLRSTQQLRVVEAALSERVRAHGDLGDHGGDGGGVGADGSAKEAEGLDDGELRSHALADELLRALALNMIAAERRCGELETASHGLAGAAALGEGGSERDEGSGARVAQLEAQLSELNLELGAALAANESLQADNAALRRAAARGVAGGASELLAPAAAATPTTGIERGLLARARQLSARTTMSEHRAHEARERLSAAGGSRSISIFERSAGNDAGALSKVKQLRSQLVAAQKAKAAIETKHTQLRQIYKEDAETLRVLQREAREADALGLAVTQLNAKLAEAQEIARARARSMLRAQLYTSAETHRQAVKQELSKVALTQGEGR